MERGVNQPHVKKTGKHEEGKLFELASMTIDTKRLD
jgi:hypothetical protein